MPQGRTSFHWANIFLKHRTRDRHGSAFSYCLSFHDLKKNFKTARLVATLFHARQRIEISLKKQQIRRSRKDFHDGRA